MTSLSPNSTITNFESIEKNKEYDNCSVSCSDTCDTCSNISSQIYCKTCDPKCKYLDCICDESWKNFDEILLSINNISSDILLEKLRISTITLCFNLNHNINIKELSKKYVSKNCGKFYNSLIFNWHTKYQFKTVVSVKIFPNGKVQIAGLGNIKSCCYIIRKTHRKCSPFFIKNNENQATKEEIKEVIKEEPNKEPDKEPNKEPDKEPYKEPDKEPDKEPNIKNCLGICDIKIGMINTDFKIKNILNLTSYCDLLSKCSVQSNGNFLSVVYQPIKYPAINTKYICDYNLQNYYDHVYKYSCKKKFNQTLSILIFRSGSIIITGGNNIEDYKNAYSYILELMNKNRKDLFI